MTDSKPASSIVKHESVTQESPAQHSSADDFNNGSTGRWLLVMAMLSGLVNMTPVFRSPALALDEHGTFWICAKDSPLTLWQRCRDYENIPPLSPWLHRLFMDVFGESELAFRFPNILWFLGAITATYFLGRELMGPLGGGLAAIVVAWHPNILGEIRLARCYSLTVFLAANLMLVSALWARSPTKDSIGRTARLALAWAFNSSSLAWTHYLNVAIVIASFAILAFLFIRRCIVAFVFLIAAAVVFLATCLPLTPAIERMVETGQYFGFQAETPFFQTVGPLWWLGLPSGLVAAVVISRLTRHRTAPGRGRVRNPGLGGLLLLGFLPTLLAAMFLRGEHASLANPRYRVGFEIAAACLVVAVIIRNRTKPAAIAGVAVALLMSWSVAELTPWQARRIGSERSGHWREIASIIERDGQPGEPVFVQSGLGEGFLIPVMYNDPVFLDYAACRVGRMYLKSKHPMTGLPFVWSGNSGMTTAFQSRVEELARSDSPVLWLAAATDTDLNRSSSQYFRDMLRHFGFQVTKSVVHPEVTLERFQADNVTDVNSHPPCPP